MSKITSDFKSVDNEVSKIHNMLVGDISRYSNEFITMVDFVLRELLNNAAEHGNCMNENKAIVLGISLTREKLTIDVQDEGKGYDIQSIISNEKITDKMRLRNRGLLTIYDFGFIIENIASHVIANYKITNENGSITGGGMSMNIYNEGKIVFCDIYDNLVASNVKNFIEQLKASLDSYENYEILQINLSKTESIDSMGITFLISTYKTINSRGKTVRITGISDGMLKVFKMMKLDEVFNLNIGPQEEA